MFLVEDLDDATIVRVSGDLDREASPGLGAILAFAQTTTARRIVVSLEKCNYCDSSGLSVLLKAHKASGSNIVVVVPDGARCRRAFDVTGLCKILNIVPTMPRALAAELPIAV